MSGDLMRRSNKVAAIASVLFLAAASTSHAASITNGDFEANGDVITVDSIFPVTLAGLPVPTGWTSLKAGSAGAWTGIHFVGGGAVVFPSHFAELTGGGGI